MTNSHEMPPPIKSAPFYVNFMQYRLIQHFVVLELAIAGAATTMRSASIVAQKKQKGSLSSPLGKGCATRGSKRRVHLQLRLHIVGRLTGKFLLRYFSKEFSFFVKKYRL